MGPQSCVFCGAAGVDLTREHLWPQWMSRFFREHGIADDYTRLRRQTPDPAQVDEQVWRERSLSTSAPNVCVTCNNNVLSELENEHAKPVLVKLCAGESSMLSIEEQVALAAWITRFAMVFELTRDAAKLQRPFFSLADRRKFMECLEPPADAWIWLASLDSQMVAGATAGRGKGRDGSSVLCVTGSAGALVFQFYVRKWRKRPSTDVVSLLMAPILSRWALAAVQLAPNIWHELSWPPKVHLGNRGFTDFINRWGGAAKGPGETPPDLVPPNSE